MENLVFSHEAFSRDVFARGALEALLWIRGRRGIFRFDDMAAEIMDELFFPGRGSERNN
jgi:dihydrodipicolinate reductase